MELKYVPLGLDGIDEGLFVARVANAFAKIQADVIDYTKLHGEAAVGAKAKFQIEITLGVEDPVADDQISIVSQIKSTMPHAPASASKAVAGQTDNGEGALFVRASGSSAASPAQGVLATQDGRLIDQDTGRAADKALDDARD
jgi:hypothetical protein